MKICWLTCKCEYNNSGQLWQILRCATTNQFKGLGSYVMDVCECTRAHVHDKCNVCMGILDDLGSKFWD